MEDQINQRSMLVSWLIVLVIVLIILIQGIFSFKVVGDRGQPDWDYRPVKDVPGESPYAMYELLPYPQHIRGKEGK
jgi:hypothetical protein